MNNLSPIGLDIGRSRMAAAQVRRRAGSWEITGAVEIDRLRTEDPPGRAEMARLSSVLYRQGFVGCDVVVGGPDEHLVTSTLEAPPQAAGAPMGAMARVELSRTLKCGAHELEVAWWNLPATLRGKEAVHFLATAISHRTAGDFLDAVECEGLRAIALEPRVCALARACGPMLRDPSELYAIVEVGWDAACIVVVYRGEIVYGRSNAGKGLAPLVQALHADLNIDVELAEHLMFKDPGAGAEAHGPASKETRAIEAGVRQAVEEHLESIAKEGGAALSYACHRYPEASVKEIILAGRGAELAGTPDVMSARLEAPASLARPADLRICPPALREVCVNPGLCAALGLAMHGLEGAA